jgi:hypothetical protein
MGQNSFSRLGDRMDIENCAEFEKQFMGVDNGFSLSNALWPS